MSSEGSCTVEALMDGDINKAHLLRLLVVENTNNEEATLITSAVKLHSPGSTVLRVASTTSSNESVRAPDARTGTMMT